MNREEVIRMAREIGLQHDEEAEELYSLHYTGIYLDDLERFANLVAASEREACAKQAENMDAAVLALLNNTRQPIAIAAAIRARGEK